MRRNLKLTALIASPCLVALSCLNASAQSPLVRVDHERVAQAIAPIEDEITPVEEDAQVAPDDMPIDDVAPQGTGETARPAEVIRERYPNGAVKIERQISEDAAGNLVNHGRWTQWDNAGNVIGMGEYRQGKQDGRWLRYLAGTEGKMFAATPYKQFSRPFLSEVTFNEGQMNGIWSVVDAKKRRIMQCEFVNDKPHGVSIWFYANGQKMREVTYKDGKLDGEFLEWNPNNQLVVADLYKEGRKHAVKVEWYSQGKKKSEGTYLFSRQITEETYDWWNASVTSKNIGKEGDDQRHGHWTWWYPTGMKKMEGSYENGAPSGKFVWWYPNSQKFIEGEYVGGKQSGLWTWWHANGLTQFRGEYVNGQQTGRWTGYTLEGKLVEVQDFNASAPQALYDAEVSDLHSGGPEAANEPLQAVRPQERKTSRRR